MVISAVSDIGISTYVVTRLSARQGDTPPVEAVNPVGFSGQGSEEISWMEAMSLFGSSGAVVQRLSMLSRSSGENFQIEQYLAMDRERIEQQRMDQYRPQLDAVA